MHNLKKFFSQFKIEKYPTPKQWKQFFKKPHQVLATNEKIAFFVFLVLFLGSSFSLFFDFYFKNTEIKPAQGGGLVEGVVGQPRFINPVYAAASDVDRDLVELIFSGLMKYDGQGKIVPDLAKNYEVKEEGKIFEVELRENVLWSDGRALSADDVVFTFQTLQDANYKSPVIAGFLGVKIEKISDAKVRFVLRNPYGPFLENLTQKIIPKHIWQDVNAENFPLTTLNLEPVGSGPYKLKDLRKDRQGRITSVKLARNERYYGKNPYLSQIAFRFYNNEEELIKSYQRGEVNSFSVISLSNLENVNLTGANNYSLYLPRYFAVFFNPEKSKTLADKSVRQALNYATNKDEIIEKILLGRARAVHSPILPDVYGFSPPAKIYQFDPAEAANLLEKTGFLKNAETGLREKSAKKDATFQFKSDLRTGSQGKEVEELQKCLAKDPEVYKDGTISGYFGENTKTAVIKFQEKYDKDILEPWGFKQGTGIVSKTTRDKLNELCFPSPTEVLPLKFSLATVKQPTLIQVAELLKEQWAKLGVEIEIITFDISLLEKDVIKPRNYEILLFGNVLPLVADPFAFWHSNQIKDPGLNLSAFQSKQADELLKESRQTVQDSKRKENLEQFQDILIQAAPAVFLYNPEYAYFLPKNIKEVKAKIIADPSKRFAGIEDWYIKEKRVWQLSKKR